VIKLAVTYTDSTQKVVDAADKATFRNLARAAFRVRKTAIASITTSKVASSPGKAPHTKRGNLRRAILYGVDKKQRNAFIGPRFSVVGEAGAAHEFGEKYRDNDYPERPFMGPALDEATPEFAQSFAGSIGE
jgi:hypothetical protein